ncbi:family 78 glycoside hydrolase catalytic domain [Paenibacillus sp. CF384]|uniref:alpha-L-rhamnosidase-related protein n=1 Tax=Paenibacillus sp. CF384 TaxID=1884382 RepID=UPI0008942591|nr:family 78 glycoside hydrolase catalytic domain [Paenibacillus sp. CF384]SDW80271.1 alpha-L-rhamnosidase [Paenibacillus sp. CF384]
MINQSFVDAAEELKPELIGNKVSPARVVDVVHDSEALHGWKTQHASTFEELQEQRFSKGDSFVLDFGDHQVGYLTISLQSVEARADAPVRLKFIFGEMPCEIGESFDTYEGGLDRSWLQDEIVNFDVVPGTYTLPRRYSFRYLKIEVITPARKFKLAFPDVYVTSVSSGDLSLVAPLPDHVPADLREMDRIAIRTLQDCMHTVFEDGPKRDRRLWIGDLRLQALANYETFNHYDLVKRCLYLFAGLRLEGGQVSACVYEKPEPAADDIYLYDYSLFFISTLHDYYAASQDRDTLSQLWPIALEQVELALLRLDARGIVTDDPSWYCFTDWQNDLNKQASAQAILIYCMKQAVVLAETMGQREQAAAIQGYVEHVSTAALNHLLNERTGMFESGEAGQVSWASQVWMVLAGVLDQEANGALLDRLFEEDPVIRPMTPYMYHHLIEALIVSGRKDKALEQMRAYWGEMARDGADTFWEVFQPADKNNSPYGSNLINSYCHAWSCTPTYFIRKYFAGS